MVDGQDFFAVHEAARTAIERARKGEGPTLIECKTYRHYGHFEGDTQRYKRLEDMELYTGQKDPLTLFKARVLSEGWLTKDDLAAVEEKVENAVKVAMAYAIESPDPLVADLETDVLAV